MKRITVLSAISLIALAQIAFAQLNPDLISANTSAGLERPRIDPAGQIHSQFLIFDDNNGAGDSGTYNPTDSFGFDIYLTYEGYDSVGLSLWFETTASAAPGISITGFTYGTTFSDPIQGDLITFPVGFTLPESNGMYTTPNPSCFGALVPINGPDFTPVPPGTYFVGHLSMTLSGLPPGIYVLQSAVTDGHQSVVTSYDPAIPPNFFDENIPAATYTITIVPEPSVFALLTLGAISGGAWSCRRATSKRPRS